MRQSQLFTKTLREAPADELAINAQLLKRGGFVFKNSSGIYTLLPLGWRVIQKIANVIREEINVIGGQELFTSALIEKKYMEPTARWDLDVGYFAKTKSEKEAAFVLGWSHEEILTSIAAEYISSYKDLPFAAYQIQTKFRHEARAKSGLLRSREFLMKDLYSFHASQKDLDSYYQKVKGAYHKIFKRCGLNAIYTIAAGGVFTEKFTHEFQVLSPIGEDTIMLCPGCDYAENVEISKLEIGGSCNKCGAKVIKEKSIEVGNIFDNGTRYSTALGLEFTDESGNKQPVLMGAYGIGLGRVMGTVVEIHNDKNGIIWPENITPYKTHLISLPGGEEESEKIYSMLTKKGAEVLFDNRNYKTAGEKFADADLIGCPIRLVVSAKTLEKNSAELKYRNKEDLKLIKLEQIINFL